MKRAVLILLLLVAVGGLLPARNAAAHAALVVSEPANNDLLQRPPDRIRLSFSEPVDQRTSGIRLLDARGVAIELAGVEFADQAATMRVTLPQLKPGIYNVQWFNVSTVDGHGLLGSFPFTVLNPDGTAPESTNTVAALGTDLDPPPLADGVAVRLLALIGLAIAAGAALLTLLWPEMPETTRKLLGTAALAGAAMLLVGAMLNLRVIQQEFAVLPLRDLVFSTRIGGYWLTRLGAAMLIAVTATMLFDAPRKGALGVFVGSLLTVGSFAMTSHAAAGTGSAWGTAIDLVHGVAAICWIGVVIAVAIAARASFRSAPPGWLLARFSLTASLLVFFLLMTGLLSMFVEVNSTSRLTSTRYGWTIVAKVALMAPLLGLALYNARWGKRRLTSSKPGARRTFAMLAGGEALLGLVVFVPAAMLTQTGVAKSVPQLQETRAYNSVQPAGDLGIAIAVDPNKVGLNSYFVKVTTRDGEPVIPERVRLTFRYQEDANVGAATLTLAKTQDNVFSGQGPYLTLQGRWRVEVEIRRPARDDVKAFFDIRPAGPPVVVSQLGGRWENPAPGLTWNEFSGFILLMTGLGFAIWRRPLSSLGRYPGYSATAMTALGFGIGTLLLFGVHKEVPTGTMPTNPIYPDENSISQGKRLYTNNCAACHGLSGVPPKGLALNPYPLDLTVHVPQHPADGQLFTFVRDGFPGTAMRAWGTGDGKLSDEKMWHLVNFLRTLTDQSK